METLQVKWLLMIMIFVNGEWVTADNAVPDWKPMVFNTEAECTEVKEIVIAIELQIRERYKNHSHLHMILPRIFECFPRFVKPEE